MTKHRQVKVLLLDIETAPNKVYTWGLYNQNIGGNQIIERGYVLCYCAKWVGHRDIISDAIWNYPSLFNKEPQNDKKLAESVWKLVDEADIVITHNGNKFDLKWLNTIFLKAGLPPVSSYKSVDTLQHAKANFYFVSNALQNISQELSLGKKVETGGFDLWTKAMKGQKLACDRMIRYCKHDVRLLQRLYFKIKPYIRNHPNMNLYTGRIDRPRCKNCESDNLRKKGVVRLSAGLYQRFICLSCGRDQRDGHNLLTKEDRKNVLRGIK